MLMSTDHDVKHARGLLREPNTVLNAQHHLSWHPDTLHHPTVQQPRLTHPEETPSSNALLHRPLLDARHLLHCRRALARTELNSLTEGPLMRSGLGAQGIELQGRVLLNTGAFIIRIRFWGLLCYNYRKEPPK